VHRTHCSARQSYLNGLLQGLQIEQLAFENGMLSQISSTDVVTGAANRRQLEDALRLLCAEPACGDFLLLADVDFFKRFNDRHGHLAGDECLREVVTAIKGQLRRTDLVARFGGEEFAVVLPRTTRADAVAAAERIREAVQGHSVTIDGQAKNVTVSIGLAERVEGTTPGMLIGMADGALYAAKRGGRNCVRCAAQVEVGIPA
jgi:diguanylate cyclase (GGDEF)-like protein